jgi:hypothetical protein
MRHSIRPHSSKHRLTPIRLVWIALRKMFHIAMDMERRGVKEEVVQGSYVTRLHHGPAVRVRYGYRARLGAAETAQHVIRDDRSDSS